MKIGLSYDDIFLFASVARSGSLSLAAEQVHVSPATLSRRLRALEGQIGRRLFQHGAQGYALTSDGRALLTHAERMERAAAEITAWQRTTAGPVPVRISAGTWTSLHLAAHLPRLWSKTAAWVPEFVSANRDLDIARREIDIGIRNRRPAQAWLAGQQTGMVDYAVYAASERVSGWIGPSDDAARTRSARWLEEHHGADIVTRANDPRLVREMAAAGIGRVILPIFIGGEDDRLVRLSDPIEALRSEEWLVSHNETRFEPAIRSALDALSGLLTSTRSTHR